MLYLHALLTCSTYILYLHAPRAYSTYRRYIFLMVTASLTLFYKSYFSCLHLLNVAQRVPTMLYVGQVL
jgi:hypothetical protein